MLQKYFIAIVPPEPLLSEVREIKQTIFETYQIKGALRSPAHITLHMPFSFEENKEDKLIACLKTFRFNEPFFISLLNYGCFEPRVVFINVEQQPALFELQSELVRHVKQQLRVFNQAEDMRGFHPHVTIAFRDLKKPVFYKLWESYRVKHFKGNFNCRSFAILKHVNDRWVVLEEFGIED